MKEPIPTICRYCAGRVVLTDTSELYGAGTRRIYLCTNCNAYVGVQEGTDLPLGKLANTALRHKRQEAHELLDRVTRRNGWKKPQAYRWLSTQMRLPACETHIGYFEMDACERSIRLCREELADKKAA